MFIRIEPSSGTPILRQIADQIRAQCASGRLKPGDQLPSVRELAGELAVNQNTILHVYERLAAEGLLERRQGAGTYVAERLPAGQLSAQRQLLQAEIRRLAEKAQTLGLTGGELRAMVEAASREAEKNERMALKGKGEGKTVRAILEKES